MAGLRPPFQRQASNARRGLCWLALAGALLLASGCATRSPAYDRDGAPATVPPGLAQRPDAEPRIEALRVGGPNKPYEVLGRRYLPLSSDLPLAESGLASWYGRKFHGKPTASGEPYDMFAMTAAHKTMPIPSYARVHNPANGREVIVRINDRGPFSDGRVIDLSYTAALKLGVLNGVTPVTLRRITHAEIRAGSNAAVAAQDDPVAAELPLASATASGFWLQLGAFRQREAALQLQQRLLREWPGQGVAVIDESALFRVQLGPYENRAQAQEMAARVQAQSALLGLVLQRP